MLARQSRHLPLKAWSAIHYLKAAVICTCRFNLCPIFTTAPKASQKLFYLFTLQVKKKQHERRSQPKELTPTDARGVGGASECNNALVGSGSNNSRNNNIVQNDKEELEFNFDEDLDIPQGRQNKFSSLYV